jgi:hypothetical protein
VKKRYTRFLLLMSIILLYSFQIYGQKINTIYWTDYNYGTPKLGTSTAAGSSPTTVSLTANTLPQGTVFLKSANPQKVLWSELQLLSAKINSASGDLSSPGALVSNLTANRGITADETHGKIYWVSTVSGDNKIMVANIDGSSPQTLISFSSDVTVALRDVAVDPTGNGTIYWSDFGNNKIWKASLSNLNGKTNIITETAADGVTGLSLDLFYNKIYWTDINSNKIKRSNLDGTTVETLISSGLDRPQYISVDNLTEKIFWTEDGNTSQHIRKSNLDGTSVTNLPMVVNNPGGISVYNNDIRPVITGIEQTTLSYTISGQAITITSTTTASDADDANLSGATIQITGGYQNSQDILDFTNANGITGSWNSKTGTMTLSGTASIANYQAAINSVTYNNTSKTPDNSVRTVSFKVNDGIANSVVLARNISLNVPLPVELISFKAATNNSEVTLNWQTATEVNNYGFNIERASLESGNASPQWIKIGFVQGHGNSNSTKNYSFTDSPVGGTKFQYRLKQLDNDGKYKYSNVLNVKIDIPVNYAMQQNYPNPFNPTTNIKYSITKESQVTLKVYDVIGKEVGNLVNQKQAAGSYEVNFNASKLTSGVYIYILKAGDYVRSMKMIMIK